MPAQTLVHQEKTGRKVSPDRTVVLCSRGHSFVLRLDTVADYAVHNHIRDVVLLHCPEEKYIETFAAEIQEQASAAFAQVNDRLIRQGYTPLQFFLDMRKGMLHDNIAVLLQERSVAVVFVGMKMLDYRLSEIQKLKTAFYFIGSSHS